MGLFNLSSVKNHPRRSGFDLSSKVAFTAKVGELLPVKWTLTMPGDKFSLKEQHFTRTQPVNTSAYTRVREYYDWFWCPLHLLWRNAPEVIAQIQQNVQHASSYDGSILLGSNMPCVSLSQLSSLVSSLKGRKNYFGFDRSDLSYKILQYLRYGNVQTSSKTSGKNFGTSIPVSEKSYTQDYLFNHALSVFPLLAYKKFCQDYFRLTQWQDSAPYLWNIDYYDAKKPTSILPDSFSSPYTDNNTLIDMEYCNWNKDMFFGVLPDAQYGDTSVVDISFGISGQSVVASPSDISSRYTISNSEDSSTPDLSGSPLVFDVLALRRGEPDHCGRRAEKERVRHAGRRGGHGPGPAVRAAGPGPDPGGRPAHRGRRAFAAAAPDRHTHRPAGPAGRRHHHQRPGGGDGRDHGHRLLPGGGPRRQSPAVPAGAVPLRYEHRPGHGGHHDQHPDPGIFGQRPVLHHLSVFAGAGSPAAHQLPLYGHGGHQRHRQQHRRHSGGPPDGAHHLVHFGEG